MWPHIGQNARWVERPGCSCVAGAARVSLLLQPTPPSLGQLAGGSLHIRPMQCFLQEPDACKRHVQGHVKTSHATFTQPGLECTCIRSHNICPAAPTRTPAHASWTSTGLWSTHCFVCELEAPSKSVAAQAITHTHTSSTGSGAAATTGMHASVHTYPPTHA